MIKFLTPRHRRTILSNLNSFGDSNSKNGLFEGYVGIWVWLILRLIFSLWVGIASGLRPLTYLEQTVPAWPPSLPLGNWVERFLLSPWFRWDGVWFHRILTEGYLPENGTAAFHPLFPGLAKPLYFIGVNPILSLLLINGIASLGMLYLLERLARLDMSVEQARFGVIMFLTFPVGLALFAPYTEGLYLLWVVICFSFARKKYWLLARLAGALAALMRQQGIFLVFPLAWELWETCGRDLRQLIINWRNCISFCLIPVSYSGWIAYRIFILGEHTSRITSLNDFINQILIPASTNRVVPSFSFTWPWVALSLAVERFIESPDLDLGVNLFLGLVFIIGLFAGWKFMRPSYRLYVLVITLISFSDHTGSIHPYMGLPRHLWLAFPVFLTSSLFLTPKWVRVSVVSVSLFGMFFLFLLFVIEAWVP